MTEPPEENSAEAEFTFSPFIKLLADAITFCHLAENPSLTISARSALVRASILNTVFALECVANALLNGIELSKHIYAQFERMPLLDKYEAVLLLISPAHEFDRGRKEIQAIKDLIDLRNRQVHIKVTRQKLKGQTINKAWWTFEPMENNIKGNLGIPENSDQWFSSHAELALQALDAFLKLYLIDWAHLDPEHVAEMLLSHAVFGDRGATLMPEDSHSALELARSRMKLKLEFIELEVSNVRVSLMDKGIGDILVNGRDDLE